MSKDHFFHGFESGASVFRLDPGTVFDQDRPEEYRVPALVPVEVPEPEESLKEEVLEPELTVGIGTDREAWQNRAMLAPITNRGVRHYRSVFDKPKKEDAWILDLGSGASRGTTLGGVKLDYRYRELENKPDDGIAVAGLFQELPFIDESFDGVTASWSIWWTEGEARTRSLEEAIRVTKDGGVVQIHPVSRKNKKEAKTLEHDGITKMKTPKPFIEAGTLAVLASIVCIEQGEGPGMHLDFADHKNQTIILGLTFIALYGISKLWSTLKIKVSPNLRNREAVEALQRAYRLDNIFSSITDPDKVLEPKDSPIN